MSGAINMGANSLTNLAAPSATSDAANKGYVDTNFLKSNGSVALTGPWNIGTQDMTNVGNMALAASKTLNLGTYGVDPGSLTSADKGKIWFNTTTNQLKYWDGAAAQALGVSGSGLTNLNGQTGGTQTFAVTATGTAPAFNSASTIHTLSIPMASSASVSAGLISNTDYATFSAKQASGNYITGLTGDLSATGPGSATATLSPSGVSVGTYVKVTVDTKGRVTAGSSLAASDLPTHSAGLITSGTLGSTNGGTGVNSTATFPATGVVVTEAAAEILTNKTLTSPLIGTIVNTGTLTLPTTTDTLVGRATSDTLTNKILTSPVITSGTISGASLITGTTSINTTGTIASGAISTTGGLTIKGTGAASNLLTLSNGANTFALNIKAPDALASSVTWTLPPTDGTSGQVLSTNGSGSFSWASVGGAGSGGTAGGDLSGTYPNPALITTGVTAGSYTRVTVDAKGRVTAGTSLQSADLPSVPAALVTGTLPVSNGGTGATNFTNNGVLLGNTTSNILSTTAGTAYQSLTVPSGGGTPTFSALNLSQGAAVTGTLTVANGGTGVTTGSQNLMFATPSGSSGAPSLRALTAADLPVHSAALIASGTLGVANGGTGLTATPTNGQILVGNGAGYTMSNIIGVTGLSVASSAGTITISASADPSLMVRKDGSTSLTGPWNVGQDLSSVGNMALLAAKTLNLGTYGVDPAGLVAADKGKIWFNTTTNQMKYWDGSAAQALGVAGAGLTSLGGQTASTQTFAAGTAGTAPAISSSSSVHTLNIPLASSAGVTAGLISNGDYAAFTAKQAAGNYITALSGDLTATGPGAAAATLAPTGVGAGSYTKVTVDAKGRVTAGASLVPSDIPALSAANITSGALATANGGTGVSSTATFPSSGVVVTEGAVETLLNKSLTSPVITSGTITNAVITGTSSISTSGTISTSGSITSTGLITSQGLNSAGTIQVQPIAGQASALRFFDNGGSYSVSLKAPGSLGATNYTLTLPVGTGSNGNVMVSDGSGNLTWNPMADNNRVLKAGDAMTGNLSITGGSLGIGTGSPSAPLHIYGNSNASSKLMIQNTGAGTAYWSLGEDTTGNLQFVNEFAVASRMTLTPSGNLGIGTTAPNGLLDVYSGSVHSLFVQSSSGNVGVGTTSPMSNFDVAINIASTPIAQFINTNNSPSTALGVVIQAGSSTGTGAALITFKRGGDSIMIGSVTQSASTGVSYNSTSDRRLKENIVESGSGLELLSMLKVHDYNYIADPAKQTLQGFIAQELYEIYPQAVTVGGDDPKTNPWQVDYGKLTPLLVKSVQDLKRQVDEKDAEIEQLKSDSRKIKAALCSLKDLPICHE